MVKLVRVVNLVQVAGVSIAHFANRVPSVKILPSFSKFTKKNSANLIKKTQDRSDKVESRLKPNPTKGPKAKMTSDIQLSN